MVVHIWNIDVFLDDDDQGQVNGVRVVDVPKDQSTPGELCEPVVVETKPFMSWRLHKKLAVQLWDWTENELQTLLV